MTGRRSQLLFALLVVAATLAAYSSAIRGGFIWDDDHYVTENPELRTAEGLERIWTEPRSIPQYYPLVHTTFWVEWQLWGKHPFGYHLNNVLLHILVALLAWRALRRLKIPGAEVAALLFALHPVTVESAAWITERKNVLSGVLYLGAMLAYFRFEAPEGRDGGGDTARPRRWGVYALALLLFLGALLSKSVTSTLPAAILLLFWWKRGRLSWRDFVPLLPMFLLGITLGLHTSYLERVHVGASGPEWDFSFVERCLIAGRASWFYLGKALWPVALAFIYPRWVIDAGAWWQWLFPIGAGGLVAGLWWMRHRIGRAPLTALLFFGGTLFPALGFFDVYPMRYSFVADHFQYLALWGPIVLLVSTGAILLAERRALALSLAGIAVLLLGAQTWRQGRIYDGPIALWEDNLTKNPEGWMINYHLAYEYLWLGDQEKAEHFFTETIRLHPDSFDSYLNLGVMRIEQRRFAEAKRLIGQALESDRERSKALCALGNVFELEGNLAGAERQYRLAIATGERVVTPYVDLARLLAQRGESEEAVALLAGGVDLEPHRREARVELAKLHLRRGEREDAARHLDLVLEKEPDHFVALYLRGKLWFEAGERGRAARLFERIRAVRPRYVQANPDLQRMLRELAGG